MPLSVGITDSLQDICASLDKICNFFTKMILSMILLYLIPAFCNQKFKKNMKNAINNNDRLTWHSANCMNHSYTRLLKTINVWNYDTMTVINFIFAMQNKVASGFSQNGYYLVLYFNVSNKHCILHDLNQGFEEVIGWVFGTITQVPETQEPTQQWAEQWASQRQG